jgi:hypothetical protein
MRLRGKLSVALTATLLIAGCGGDDGGSGAGDEQAIKDVIVTALTSADPQVECADTVTENFVTTVYGSLVNCKAAEAKPDDSKPATGASVANLKIDGERATADVTTVGGASDGSHGELSLAKENGDWKVDELSVAFLRSSLTVQVSASREDAFADANVRECFVQGMSKLSDDVFLDVAYDGIARRDPHPKFVEIFQTCSTSTRDDSGISVLRKQFESGITEAAQKDKTPRKAIDCVLRALRKSITDDEIISLSQNASALGRRVATAMKSCDAAG